MHIVIFGVGAIGGFYGTKIAHYINKTKAKDLKISFVARGRTFQILKTQGSKLICKKGNFAEMQETIIIEKDLSVFESYSELDIDPDELTVVLLCTKSKDTIPASLAIKRKFNDNTLIVSVQNGVDNEEKIASILNPENVIGCLTNVAAETLEPGIYLQKGNYGLLFGEMKANLGKTFRGKNRIDLLAKIFGEAGINIKTTETITKDQWSKLVWNASFNPISVLYGETVGKLLDDPEIKARIYAVMKETLAVAKAQGIDLPDDVAEKHIERTSAPDWYDFRTSMLQDYQKGKAIELNELLGVVIERGKKYNTPTPEASKLYEELLSRHSEGV